MTDTGVVRPYTVALLADIHGNLDAFEAVLADLAHQPHDAVVIAGDHLVMGPQPAKTLARLRELDVPTIFGNIDREVVEGRPHSPLISWTREQIGEAGIAYLEALPFSHHVTPPQQTSPEADLFVVHATPTSVYPVLLLEANALSPLLNKVTPEEEAAALLGAIRANLIVFGHIHYASSGTIRGQRVVSIGSVGFPFDGDPRAAYALASWDGAQWQIQHRRVAYDRERTIEAVQRSGQPQASWVVQVLSEARFVLPS
jgi:predicted phosphodiesterase